jgi:hypothetical protein
MSIPIDLTAKARLAASVQNKNLTSSVKELVTNSKLPDFTVGQKVQAQVLASLSEGLYLANLNGQTFQINLPRNIKTGGNLTLTFLSYSPQATFQLVDGHSDASIVHIGIPTRLGDEHQSLGRQAKLLDPSKTAAQLEAEQQLNLSTASNTTANASFNADNKASSSATLSQFAQVFGQIFANARANKQLSILEQIEPVVALTSDLANPTAVAAALENAIKSSGLFYEHHLNQWVQNKFEKKALATEPQNNLDALTSKQESEGTNSTNSFEQALAFIVTKQLDVLENDQLQWFGKLTPETPFEWYISRRREKVNRELEEETNTWQTDVKFSLPNLGEVAATIFLQNSNLKFMLSGETPETLGRLKANASSLTDSLSAHGAQISMFAVEKPE